MELELRTEGELLHLAITKMQDNLACTKCESVGNKRKNRENGPTLRSWKCESCPKHTTGQMIPAALENQFGSEWRRSINRRPPAAEKESTYSTAKQNSAVVESIEVLATRTGN